MKTNPKLWLASGLTATLVTLTACSGGSDTPVAGGNPPPGGTGTTGAGTVPDSAGTSVGGFIAFLKGLSPTDETSEPLVIKDSFAVPADETGVPEPLV